MDIRQLKYFMTSAQTGSFSEAAQALYTSQPHVSMVVKELEQELGMPLLQRNARGVVLTADGERVYGYAKNIMKNVELIRLAGEEKKQERFSVAANPSSSVKEIFADFVKARQGDQVTFVYREGGVEAIMEMLSSHEAQMGFLFVPEDRLPAFSYLLERKRLEFIPLTESRLVLYAGPHSPLYGERCVSPARLRELRFVQLEEDDYFTTEDLFASMQGVDGVSLNRVVETNSSAMVMKLLLETDLCNLSGFWNPAGSASEEIAMIRVEGCEEKILFGYLKRRGEEIGPYGEGLLLRARQCMGKGEQV